MLKKYQLESSTPILTPIAQGIISSGPEVDIQEYQSKTGSIMWPSLGSRPDISYSAGFLGRANASPTTAHSTAQKRVLRYLNGTKDYGIFYNTNSTEGLVGYSDSDYAGNTSDRKSTTGIVFTMLGGAISWSSSKQKTVSTSTVQAEYTAMSSSVKEALWIKQLLEELSFTCGTVSIRADSQGALDLALNAQFSQKTKHIDIKHHFIRDHTESGDISLSYIPTDEMTADILTKPLPRPAFEKLRAKLGIRSLNEVIQTQEVGGVLE